MNHVLIRRELAADVAAIRDVTAAAFGGQSGGQRGGQSGGQGETRPPQEALLVDELRAGPAWLPPLSLVATGPDGDVIGHVLCTRAHVGQAPVLGLGPLSVRPDSQRRGVGSALVHAVLGAADALDEPLVVLLGSTAYYRRFGFRLCGEYQIVPPRPQWQPHFQVRPLTAYQPGLRGTFAYAEPFDRT